MSNKDTESIKYNIEDIVVNFNYTVVYTDKSTFLIFENEVYDIGDYKKIDKVFKMNDKVYFVAGYRLSLVLVDLSDLSTLLAMNSYGSNIRPVDDTYINVRNSEVGDTLYNLNTKEYIKVDKNLKYYYQIGDNAFVYKNVDDDKQRFIVNEKGDILYSYKDCYPVKIDDKLVFYNNDEIKIVSNYTKVNTEERVEIVLKKDDEILSTPFLYKDKYIVALTKEGIKILNVNLEEVKTIPVKNDKEVNLTQLWDYVYIIEVNNGERASCIAVNLENGFTMQHDSIWVLPFDVEGPKTLRCADKVDDKVIFSLFDTDGNQYCSYPANDAFVIGSAANNKYFFSSVNGTKYSVIFNIDTNKEDWIPNVADIKFKIVDMGITYSDKGYIVRFNESGELFADFIDEYTNKLWSNLALSDYGINRLDFGYHVLNNLLHLIVLKSCGPQTFRKHIILDKNKNVLFDSYDIEVSIIGDYMRVVEYQDDYENPIKDDVFINSKTGEFIRDKSAPLKEMELSSDLQFKNNKIVLKK